MPRNCSIKLAILLLLFAIKNFNHEITSIPTTSNNTKINNDENLDWKIIMQENLSFTVWHVFLQFIVVSLLPTDSGCLQVQWSPIQL